MLVGQGGDKKIVPAPAPAPAAPIVASSSCCNTDPCGCESWGHRMRNKLGGLFHRDKCDSCQPSCCDTPKVHQCNTGCNDCGGGHGRRFFGGHHNSCAPTCATNTCAAPTSNDCCGGHSAGLLSNLRHRFSKNDCCCDGGCASTVAPPVMPMKTGEKIDAPKKMPAPVEPKKVPDKKPAAEEVRITPMPIAPGAITPLPTPPAVEIAPVPVPVPRVEGDRRDPF